MVVVVRVGEDIDGLWWSVCNCSYIAAPFSSRINPMFQWNKKESESHFYLLGCNREQPYPQTHWLNLTGAFPCFLNSPLLF